MQIFLKKTGKSHNDDKEKTFKFCHDEGDEMETKINSRGIMGIRRRISTTRRGGGRVGE